MSEKIILQLLQTAAIEAVNGSLPFKAMGRSGFIVPNDQKYFEFVLFRNNPPDEFWSDEKVFAGFFRLILHWPKIDEGDYEPIDVIEAMEPFFPKGKVLRSGDVVLKLVQNPPLDDAIPADKETLFPLTIFYRSFKP
jgi:hypothetical protein